MKEQEIEKLDKELHFILHQRLKDYVRACYTADSCESFVDKVINKTTEAREIIVNDIINKDLKPLGYRNVKGDTILDMVKQKELNALARQKELEREYPTKYEEPRSERRM